MFFYSLQILLKVIFIHLNNNNAFKMSIGGHLVLFYIMKINQI